MPFLIPPPKHHAEDLGPWSRPRPCCLAAAPELAATITSVESRLLRALQVRGQGGEGLVETAASWRGNPAR